MKKISARYECLSLDMKDCRILRALDANARLPVSLLARQAGLSKQVAAYRLARLAENGAIMLFYSIYDTSKLGYATYKMFVRLQNATVKKQDEIVSFLEHHGRVQFLTSTDGMFDIVFNVLAKNAADLYSFTRDFENRYGSFIAERQIALMVQSYFFPRQYLLGITPQAKRKPVFFGSVPASLSLREEDEKILSFLSNSPRTPTVKMAEKIGLSAESTASRIKALEQAGVIQGYAFLPNFSLFGQASYKVLFSLRNLSLQRENAFFKYVQSQSNIWFYSTSLGKWDAEINLDVPDASEFRRVMTELRKNFSDLIREYVTLQVSQVHKFNFYPFKD